MNRMKKGESSVAHCHSTAEMKHEINQFAVPRKLQSIQNQGGSLIYEIDIDIGHRFLHPGATMREKIETIWVHWVRDHMHFGPKLWGHWVLRVIFSPSESCSSRVRTGHQRVGVFWTPLKVKNTNFKGSISILRGPTPMSFCR